MVDLDLNQRHYDIDLFVFLHVSHLARKVISLKAFNHPSSQSKRHPSYNSYSVPSDPLEIGPELTMDYSLDNPFDSLHRS